MEAPGRRTLCLIRQSHGSSLILTFIPGMKDTDQKVQDLEIEIGDESKIQRRIL